MKFTDIIKKIDIKAGILYFALIQIEVLLVAFFLSGLPIIVARFFFSEVGTQRTVIECILLSFVELLIRFAIFISIFKNNKSLCYKKFVLSYSVTFILRLVFSLCTHFASFSAGMGVSISGIEFSVAFIDDGIKTMQQVPTVIYIAFFIVYEAITLLVALCAYRLCASLRAKIHKELHSNNI